MKYDAFISYRHGELDGLIAEKLHKALETYRIPRKLAKKLGRNKLERVFRDREELPTSSNLSDSINDALENSSFLLLICSKRTCGSMWVMREVERFGDLHGKDRIVTLLIDGEPGESFPPGLREREVGGETVFVEPLAADIRAETWAGSVKLLKEEKLRLLSPILGCAFDDLRRRHRRRAMQRAAALIGSAFAFSLSFGTFSTYQYLRINSEMRQKLINQSYVLSEYSEKELAGGDTDMALALALSALPVNLEKPNRPYVPAASNALADALGVYDARAGYKPHKTPRLPTGAGKIALSPGGGRAAVLYPGHVAVYDTESGELTAAHVTTRSAAADFEFVGEDTLAFSGRDGVTLVGCETNETLWAGAPATSIAVSGDGAVIAARGEQAAYLYDIKGQLIREINYGGRALKTLAGDVLINPQDTLFELNGDGSMLAASFADGSLAVFGPDGAAFEAYAPTPDAAWYNGAFSGDLLAFSCVTTGRYSSAFKVVRGDGGGDLCAYASDDDRFLPFVAVDGGIYVAFGDAVMAVSAADGSVASFALAGGRVESFAVGAGGAYAVCSDDGAIRLMDADGNERTYATAYTAHYAAMAGDTAIVGSRDADTFRLLKREDAVGEAVLSYTGFDFTEAKLNKRLNRAALYSYAGFRLLSLDGALIAEADFGKLPMNMEYEPESGNIVAIFDDALEIYSGTDGSRLLKQGGGVFYTPFGAFVTEAGETAMYDLSTGERLAAAFDLNGFVDGKLIGAGRGGGGTYAAAASGDAVTLYSITNSGLRRLFTVDSPGAAEAFFAGGCVFISPLLGAAEAYSLTGGAPVRSFTAANGYLADVSVFGGRIYANFVTSGSERYSLLLEDGSLATEARVPGLLSEYIGDGRLILRDGGRLRAVGVASPETLKARAELRLDGRTLTDAEKTKFKAW